MCLKKFIIPLICLAIILVGVVTYFFTNQKDSDLKSVKVAEVTHSIFYAPQYVAKQLGYFEEEGLDVEFILTPGADKVTASVLSGDVNIGLAGSEATIYVYNQGEKDYLVNFAALTKRDGSFIVARKDYKNFKLSDMKGSHVIAGRAGGMPEMTFEWALKQNGVDPKKDLNVDTSIAFAAMSGAFIGNQGDFVNLFEPNALQLEKQGYGHVVASLGELGGVVPYTAYHAKKSYIEKNPDVIEGYSKAIQKGIDYVKAHSDEEIAKVILPEFPDTSLDDVTKIVKRYRGIDSWFDTTYIEKKDFEHIEEIMESANQLEKRVPYEKLVDTTFAKKK